MQLKLILCLCLLSFNLFSQNKIEWQEPIEVSQYIKRTLKTSSSEHYTIGFDIKGLMYTYTYYISYFKNNKHIESQKIVEADGFRFLDAIINDNSVYALFEEEVDSKHTLYAQKFDESCKPSGELIKLSEVNGDFGNLKLNYFYSISQSENKKFFCVDYHLKDELTESYGYKIFSNDFKIISQGQKQLPYALEESKVISSHLTNSGRYFIAVHVFDDLDKTSLSQKKLVLHEVSNGGLNQGYEISWADNRILEVIIKSDNEDLLTLSGLYIEKGFLVPNVMGIFCKRINAEMTETIFSHEEKIDQALIMKDLSKEQAKDRKNTNEILKFKNREILFLPDSSIILIIEQAESSIGASQSTAAGEMQGGIGYDYDELFIFKLDPDGTIAWETKLPKDESIMFKQAISTHFSILKENELVLFFRDHLESYDSNGEWNKSTLRISSDYANTYKKVRIAKASINLESGEIKRSIFPDSPSVELLPIPQLFMIDELNKKMFIVMDNPFGKGEQYGVVNY